MLKGKCALITGSTQGLGYAMAERLAAEGCHIVLNGFGDPAEIEAKRRHLEDSSSVRVLHHGADLGVPAQITDLVETADRAFGSVDIVINNAVVRHFAPLEDFKVDGRLGEVRRIEIIEAGKVDRHEGAADLLDIAAAERGDATVLQNR